jgi:hypothetical protein
MAKIYDVNSVVVAAKDALLSKHDYTEVYGGSTGCKIRINGVLVNMGKDSSIYIAINTVSRGYGCFLYGVNKDVFDFYDVLPPFIDTNYLIDDFTSFIIQTDGSKILWK